MDDHTDPLAHAVLVRLADRADPGEVDAALARLTRPPPLVDVEASGSR